MSNCTGAHVHTTKGQSSPTYKAWVVAPNFDLLLSLNYESNSKF